MKITLIDKKISIINNKDTGHKDTVLKDEADSKIANGVIKNFQSSFD
jgi:hypothetical protein